MEAFKSPSHFYIINNFMFMGENGGNNKPFMLYTVICKHY